MEYIEKTSHSFTAYKQVKIWHGRKPICSVCKKIPK